MSLRRNMLWMAASQGSAFVVQFGTTVVIARLLSPYEMGVFAAALAVLGLRAVLRLRVLVAARRATVARARGEARAAAMVGAEEARTISHAISLTALQRQSLRCRMSRTTTLLARTVAAVEVAKVAGAIHAAQGRARRAELQIRIRTRRLCRLSGRMPSRPPLE